MAKVTLQNDIQDASRYLQQGNHKRALKAALSAAKKSPRAAVAWNLAGIASGATGKPNDAIKYFQRATKLNPADLDIQKNLAQTLILVGRADTAAVMLEKLATKAPEDWKIWFLRAQAEASLGRARGALASVDRAIAITPKTVTLHHLRSTINLGLGLIKDAIIDLETVLDINPDDVTALTNLSLPLARQVRSQEALEVVQKAVALEPENVAARYRLATQYVEMGQPDAGVEHYKAILQREPNHPSALEQLAHLLPEAEVIALEPTVRVALSKAPKNSENRASLFYALAQVCTAKKDPVDAAKNLTLANKELAKRTPYDAVSDSAVTQAILARFPAPLTLADQPKPSCNPIFVIGLPRSGTTLVEAMLGAHPNVYALGERGTAGFLLRDLIEQDLPFTPEAAKALIAEDQRLLPELPKNAIAYVDKMPENYRLVGFLKTAYPGCHIVNVRRDPRDVAMSMWKSHFSGSVLSYSYDWDWMAAKFNLYARSMAHWHGVLPGGVHDLRYEDLVEDIVEVGRALADFCDLEWQDGMARPDLSTDQVLTLSARQLRRPVHTGSVGKWRKDAALLTDFVKGLDDELWRDYLNDGQEA